MVNKETKNKRNGNFFYVLWCKDHSFYAGYTTDLNRREKEHNTGVGAKYTRPASRRPLKMIYAETYETRSEAMQAEAAFKRLTRPQKETYLKEKGLEFPLQKDKPCLIY